MNIAPIKPDETEFMNQYCRETIRLLPLEDAPASSWLRTNRLPAVEVASFAAAMQINGTQISLAEMLDESSIRDPQLPFLIPWSGREEFLSRQQEIQAWLREYPRHKEDE